MIAKRHPDGTDWSSDWQPGDYSKMPYGWICCTPNGEIGTLRNHTVVEHEDGTITVSPSILIHGHDFLDGEEKKTSPGWHGYLEKGVWLTEGREPA